MKNNLKNILKIRCLKFYTSCFCFIISFTSFAQFDDGFWTVPQPENAPDYYTGFWGRIVTFENGNIPFSENKKWGVKNEVGEIVLPAVYDSIFPGNYGECIVVKNGEYQALNNEFLPVFNENMRSIRFEFDTYYLIDKKGVEYRYKYSYPPKLNKVSGGENNYVIDKHEQKGLDKGLPFIYGDGTPQIDYMTFKPVANTNQSICTIYYSGTKIYRSFMSETGEAKYLGSYYFLLGNSSEQLMWLIDIRNMDTLLTIPKLKTDYFKVGNDNYLMQHKTAKENELSTTIISFRGDTIFHQNGDFSYTPGYLLKKRTDDSISIDLYAFPTGNIIDSGLQMINSTDNYLLARKTDSEENLIFNNGKQIYRFCSQTPYGILVSEYPGPDPIVAFQYDFNTKTNHYKTSILSKNGKLLFSAYNLVEFKYDMNLHGIRVVLYVDEKVTIGMYDESNECFHFTKSFGENTDQIANDIVTDQGVLSSSPQAGLQISLLNFDGDCLKEQLFNAVRPNYVNGRAFLMTYDGTELVAYDEQMNIVCEDCWIEQIYDQYFARTEREFLRKIDRKTWRSEILDNNLKRILPETYLAVAYVSQGDYFVILKDNLELEYIRYTDTDYYKQHEH